MAATLLQTGEGRQKGKGGQRREGEKGKRGEGDTGITCEHREEERLGDMQAFRATQTMQKGIKKTANQTAFICQ